MRTKIFKQSIFNLSKFLFAITGFVVSMLLSSSCSDSEGINSLEIDGSALIEKIESATKVSVASESLPMATETAFRADLADSYILKVELAKDLGYKVVLGTDNESRVEAKSDVYFSVEGTQLVDTNEKRNRKRYRCFQFEFPIDFIMPNATSITLNSKEEWTLIKDWYAENADIKERPKLVFPVNVILKDGTIQTLIDRDDLKTIKGFYKKGKGARKCFKLILPVRFTMQDGTIINVIERADFKLLRSWHKANPTVKEKGSINFPISIQFKDGTSLMVNDQKAFDAAKDAC
jgi:hypothetical protein